MRIGLPYYFEQWPRSQWEADADLMAASGVSSVRMAEFAWSILEPRQGHYDFSSLDEAIALFASRGISIILGTPTPNYPPWMHIAHPDLHRVASDGRIIEFGQRQDVCKNHGAYREAAFALVGAMAGRYGGDSRVVAWQLDNEIGNHGSEACWCPRCEAAFRSYLSERFQGDIVALNGAWGTAFWSQRYGSFSELSLPRDTADRNWKGGQNPGLVLEFKRFCSKVQIDFLAHQGRIIRKADPSAVITHNFMGNYHGIDSFALAKELDLVSLDSYPFYELQGRDGRPSSFPHALMRGLKRKNYWVIEQSSGSGGWDRAEATPEPGRMRVWAYQSVARGAEFLSFFRWRAARYGTEQFWHAILPHHGVPGARYQEFLRFCQEAGALSGELEGAVTLAKAAILLDYDSLWALDIQPQARHGLDVRMLASRFARFFEDRGVDYDVLGDCDSVILENYKLVVVPSLFICDEEKAAALSSYVEGGGTLVLGPRSGIKDRWNAVTEMQAPGLLAKLSGVLVEGFDAFSSVPDFRMDLILGEGEESTSVEALSCAEILAPGSACEVLASYGGRYYSGACAVSKAHRGGGTCVYLGTEPSDEAASAILAPLLRESGIEVFDLDPYIEVAARTKGESTYRFYINHASLPLDFTPVRGGIDILSGQRLVVETTELEALGVRIVKED